eukprot:2780446-Rhodomonas_salina.5
MHTSLHVYRVPVPGPGHADRQAHGVTVSVISNFHFKLSICETTGTNAKRRNSESRKRHSTGLPGRAALPCRVPGLVMRVEPWLYPGYPGSPG